MAHATPSTTQVDAPRPATSILIIDGNEEHLALSVTALGRHGHRVHVADSAREGLLMAVTNAYDVIVLAQKLRGGSGFEALRILADQLPDLPKIFVVAEGQEDLALRALSAGATGYLVKTARYNELLPVAVDEQLAKVRAGIRHALTEASIQERVRQQAAVATFSQQALAATDVGELLREASEVVAKTLDAEYGGVLEATPEGDVLVFRSGFGWDPAAIGHRIAASSPESRDGFTLLTGGSSILSGLQEGARFGIPPSFRELGIQSGMTAIIRIRGRPYGILGVHSKARRSFTEDDVHFLETVANTLATALERVRAEGERREAMETLRAVFESSPLPITGVDPEGRVTLWNHAAERVFGWTRDEVLGRPLPTVPRDKAEEHLRIRQDALQGKATSNLDTVRYRKDGTRLEVEVSVAPIFDARGKVSGTMGVTTDITERRREERLRAAVYRISEAVNVAPSLQDLYGEIHRVIAELIPAENLYIALHDAATNMISFPYFVDQKEERPPPHEFGRGLTEYVLRTGQPLLALPGVFDELVRQHEVVSVGPSSVDWLGVPLVTDGKAFGVLVVQSYAEGVRYSTQDRQLLEFVSDQIAMAIQRKGAEAEIRSTGERYRRMFEDNPMPMWVYDATTLRFLSVNEAAVRSYGYSRDEFLGMTIMDIRPPEDLPRLSQVLSALGPGMAASGQWRHRKKDGSVIDVEIISHETDFGGRRSRFVLVTDVTARLQAESRLARSERRFRTLFESTADGIVLIDEQGKVLDVNPAAEEVAGVPRDALIGHNLAEFIPPADLARARRFLRGILKEPGSREPFTIDMTMLDRQPKSLEIRGQAVREATQEPYVAMVIRDVTEQRRMQRRLVESERLASIGSMAGYVAHEINNPLANVALLVAAARRRTKDAEVLAKLDKIDAQRRHAATIISDILSFSKQREVQAVETDLRGVVEAAAEQVSPFCADGVRLEKDLGEAPVVVYADPLQMQEVFANLLKNAFEATRAGSVSVRIRERAEAVEVSVVDTGAGISPDLMERLFQPFFTTKQKTGGTGLGLTLCKNVVSAHGGDIQVSSVSDQGTTFTVTLPRGRAA